MNQEINIEADDIKAFQDSYVYPLMPLIREGVIHVTSIGGFRGIRESGYIIPNEGQFNCLHPQTKYYYGYSKGYICLFDFEETVKQFV